MDGQVSDRGDLAPQDVRARLAELELHRSSGVDRRLAAARELDTWATARGDTETMMRARLVAGDMLQRQGRVAEGSRLAIGVNAWAATHGSPALLARSHLVLSSVMETGGDLPGALDHAVRALELLDEGTAPRVRGNHLLRLADALALNGSTDEARRRYAEAEQVFVEIGDRERRLNVLNNLTVLEQEAGRAQEAAQTAERLLEGSGDDDLNAACADSIARARMGVGDLTGAEEIARLGFALWHAHGDGQAATPAELGLTLTEILLAAGRLDEADAELTTCERVCRERDLRGSSVEALRVRSELLAARGDHAAAYAVHRAFHAAWVELRSQQQEAAARIREALYETAEARAEAARFRSQARTDPLTGLANRRRIDEDLPRLLDEAAAAGIGLGVALIDVDHFKHVNDTYSHEAGDAVLHELGALLAAAVDDEVASWELAGRLGGEEFLLVLVAPSRDAARARVERWRASVAAHTWPGVATTITVSAGLAFARPGDTQTAVLSRADMLLLRAKRSGRDRLEVDEA